MRAISLLGDKLGPVLLQFPPFLKPDLPASSTKRSKKALAFGPFPSRNLSMVHVPQLWSMLGVTNRCPHLGQVQSGFLASMPGLEWSPAG